MLQECISQINIILPIATELIFVYDEETLVFLGWKQILLRADLENIVIKLEANWLNFVYNLLTWLSNMTEGQVVLANKVRQILLPLLR